MAQSYSFSKCNLCGKVPETPQIFQCPFKHQFCTNCFQGLKQIYSGNFKVGSVCHVCKYFGRFDQLNLNEEVINRSKLSPLFKSHWTIYNSIQQHNLPPNNSIILAEKCDPINNYPSNSKCDIKESSNSKFTSRRPIKCLHINCNKTVGVQFLEKHFNYEHQNIPTIIIERNQNVKLICDVSIIEYNLTICLGIIKLYEFGKINIDDESKCSKGLLKACQKLSTKIPINTFWLMVSGSHNNSNQSSYAVYWLYSNCRDFYKCTLELSTKNISILTSCYVVGLHEHDNIDEIAESLNCLYISRNTFLALLATKEEISLNIIIH